MAVIRILSSSKSFSGVDYNDNRVKHGQAELIAAKNFDSIDIADKNDYKQYLQLWSNANTRIKNPQLHFAISVKGNDLDKEQLLKIAEEWLEKMGYAKCPYLVYFHKNTVNNHIHVVTTRINERGQKINDSFEKQRAVRVLNEIEGVEKVNTERNAIAKLLRYSFSTRQQFIELCKGEGFDVKQELEGLKLYRRGYTINLSNKIVDYCQKKYNKRIDENRRKSIQAKIFKYAKDFDKDIFARYMKDKFGLSFVFYGKNGTINGYTVIDYNQKYVYKGSELFSLKKIIELLGENKNISKGADYLVFDFLKGKKRASLGDINLFLAAYGLKTDGRQYFDSTNNRVGECGNKVISKIMYANRLNDLMQNYAPETKAERIIVSRMYDVKESDLGTIDGDGEINKGLYYYGFIKECVEQGLDIRETLALEGIILAKVAGDYVVVDDNKKFVASVEKIGISNDEMKNYLFGFTERADRQLNVNEIYYDSNIERSEEEWEQSSWESLVDYLSSMMNVGSYGASDSYKNKKKKK